MGYQQDEVIFIINETIPISDSKTWIWVMWMTRDGKFYGFIEDEINFVKYPLDKLDEKDIPEFLECYEDWKKGNLLCKLESF